jgi:hypothetical protein
MPALPAGFCRCWISCQRCLSLHGGDDRIGCFEAESYVRFSLLSRVEDLMK